MARQENTGDDNTEFTGITEVEQDIILTTLDYYVGAQGRIYEESEDGVGKKPLRCPYTNKALRLGEVCIVSHGPHLVFSDTPVAISQWLEDIEEHTEETEESDGE